MQRVVRAFPVKNKEAIVNFAKAVSEWPSDDKKAFFANFGDVTETWHFQMIEGKPYVIGVAEGADLEKGFARYAAMSDNFTVWFRGQVKEITGFDLTDTPKGPVSELVYELRP